jgi:hypothetical protein
MEGGKERMGKRTGRRRARGRRRGVEDLDREGN